MAIRVGLGQQVALRIVGISGTAAHRVNHSGAVIDCIIFVQRFVAVPVGHAGFVPVAVVRMGAGVAQRVGLGDELAGVRIGIAVAMAHRRRLFGQAAGCVILKSGFVAQRVCDRGDVALRVGFIQRGVAQRIGARDQEPLGVIIIQGHTAARVGGFGHLALVVVLVAQIGAVFLRHRRHLVVVVVGIGFYRPVRVGDRGDIGRVPHIGILRGVPVSVSFTDFTRFLVIPIGDRSRAVRLGSDDEIVIVSHDQRFPIGRRHGVRQVFRVVGKRIVGTVRHLLQDHFAVFIVCVLQHHVPVEVGNSGQPVFFVIGIVQRIPVRVHRRSQIRPAVPVGHSTPGTVCDGGDQVALVSEGEGPGLRRDRCKVVSVIRQRGHRAVRFRHAHAMPRRVKFNVFALFIRQEVPVARLREFPQVTRVRQPVPVLLGKFHVTAARKIDGNLTMEYIHFIIVVMAPAVAQPRRIALALAGIVAAHESHLLVAFQRKIRIRPVQAARDHIHRVACNTSRDRAIARQHTCGQLYSTCRHCAHLRCSQRSVRVTTHDLTLPVIRQRERDRLHQTAGQTDHRDHILTGGHVADVVCADADPPVPGDKVINRRSIFVDGVHQHRRAGIKILIEFPVYLDTHLKGKRSDLIRRHVRHDFIRITVLFLHLGGNIFRGKVFRALRGRGFRCRFRARLRFRLQNRFFVRLIGRDGRIFRFSRLHWNRSLCRDGRFCRSRCFCRFFRRRRRFCGSFRCFRRFAWQHRGLRFCGFFALCWRGRRIRSPFLACLRRKVFLRFFRCRCLIVVCRLRFACRRFFYSERLRLALQFDSACQTTCQAHGVDGARVRGSAHSYSVRNI